jgi:hypothetical protein
MRKLLYSLPILLALTLTVITAASAQNAPGTQAAADPVKDSSAAPAEAPVSFDPAPAKAPEPMFVSVLPVTCYASCSGVACPPGTCNGTLAFCCAASRRLACKLHGGTYSGACTDGISWLTC